MTQPQNMTVDASSESVTDSGVEACGSRAPDADSRDVTCDWCARPVGDSEKNPVCFPRGEHRGERLRGTYCLPCVRRQFGTWSLGWNKAATICLVCGRHMLSASHNRTACSDWCGRELQKVLARDRRSRMREAVTPDHFDCVKCQQKIEGTVVYWWNDEWGRGRAHDVTWCESCWATMKIDHDREQHADYLDKKDAPGMLGQLTRAFGQKADPDVEGYDPFAQVGGFDPQPCGNCGRSIRWGIPDGFCCEHCKYEASKSARRVDPTERKCEAPGCGKTFTPKRSDAKTCSDKCRQALRRSKREPKKPVTATRDRRTGSSSGDAANRDKRRKGSR